MLAFRRRGRYGLFFIDGNANLFQPEAEPNGGGASMDLTLVTAGVQRQRAHEPENRKSSAKRRCSSNAEEYKLTNCDRGEINNFGPSSLTLTPYTCSGVQRQGLDDEPR